MSEQNPTGGSMRERLLFLSDGVFAIAITLLVLEIALPHITGSYQVQEQEFPGALWGLWPQVLTYALTFLIVGVYWMSHQRVFEYVVRADGVLAWLNVFFLMSVAFLPIPSNILGEYGAHGPAVRFYSLGLMLPGLWIIAMWWYATHQHRLVEKNLNARVIRHRLERYLIAPVVFLIAIGASYFNPHVAGVSLLLVVVGVAVHEIWHRIRSGRETNRTEHGPAADYTKSSVEEASAANRVLDQDSVSS
jgi:uncharacterized membrane protein